MKSNKFTLIILFIYLFSFLTTNSNAEILKLGNNNAKVTVKVFSSLTCPHCASFHEKVFKNLKKEYIDNNKIKFEHHAFPLDLAALNAEKIVRCASTPDSKFDLLTKIYESQKRWAVGSDINKINETLIKIAKDFKLNDSELRKCLANEQSQETILNERIIAQKDYNITSTPTIYINNEKYEDKHEFKSFKKQLDKLL